QLNASVTNGMNDALLPPKIIAEIGTPFGSSHAGSITGHCPAGVVNREFGCDDGLSEDGVQSFPCQSIRCAGASSVIPSHHTSPSSVRATFVKIEFSFIVSIAFALVLYDVPGATPKNPASGLIAYNLPSSPNFIHAMSSPTVSTFQPGSVGLSIARFVFPHALGKAAAIYFFSPSGDVIPTMSICSASHPCSFAM